MGLIVNKIVVSNDKAEQAAPVDPPAKPNPQPVRTLPNQNEIQNIDTSKHHILVVDGKQKKISKKSSYLLDMLEIEEEQKI